eukprot:328928-Rhodomonas_salina.1
MLVGEGGRWRRHWQCEECWEERCRAAGSCSPLPPLPSCSLTVSLCLSLFLSVSLSLSLSLSLCLREAGSGQRTAHSKIVLLIIKRKHDRENPGYSWPQAGVLVRARARGTEAELTAGVGGRKAGEKGWVSLFCSAAPLHPSTPPACTAHCAPQPEGASRTHSEEEGEKQWPLPLLPSLLLPSHPPLTSCLAS